MKAVTGLIALLLSACPAARAETVLWAWERPEALAAIPASYGVAVVIGSIHLRGGALSVRGRRFPLALDADRPQPTGVVHIEVDPAQPLEWTPELRGQVVGAALAFARPYRSVQLDMEVRASQREALLDVLRGMRDGLPPGTVLSMTALASWCEERWLAAAPVDEIVPMLFRMGPGGARLRGKLGSGGDFNEPRCRTALGIAMDAPFAVPPGRRTYVFNPRSWDAAALAALAGKEAP